MNRHRVASAFDRDLARATRRYLNMAGADVATRFLESAERTMNLIQQFPEVGRLKFREHPELGGTRCLAVQRPFSVWLIFYHAAQGIIHFDRLIHGARDLPRRLLNPES